MSTAIIDVEYELGSVTLSYEQLEERFGAAVMKKVLAGSGIRDRRVAAPDVCGSDLALASAFRLLDRRGTEREKIDLLIFCSQSPDYLLPSTACILQDRLGIKKSCAAFDLNLGCSQYIYALSVAHSMIHSGVANCALVLTGDTMTRTVHPLDRSLVPLLGDAGSATIVKRADFGQGFLGFELGSDGSGYKNLIIPGGGFRRPRSSDTALEVTDADGNVRSQENLYMNGLAIFHFAIWIVPEVLGRLLEKLSLKMADIDLFLFHQANKFMIEYLLKKLRIPPEKSHIFIEAIGNTSGTSMPVVLSEAIKEGKVKTGALVFMIVFGVGFSWAATVVRWPESELTGAS